MGKKTNTKVVNVIESLKIGTRILARNSDTHEMKQVLLVLQAIDDTVKSRIADIMSRQIKEENQDG